MFHLIECKTSNLGVASLSPILEFGSKFDDDNHIPVDMYISVPDTTC